MVTFLKSLNRGLKVMGAGLIALLIIGVIFVAPTVVSMAQGTAYESRLLVIVDGDALLVNPADSTPAGTVNLTKATRELFDGANPRRYITDARFSPNGQYVTVVFSHQDAATFTTNADPFVYGDVWLVSASGQFIVDAEVCHQTQFDCFAPHVSNNGEWLVFTVVRWSDMQMSLVLMNTDTGATRTVMVNGYDPLHALNGWQDDTHYALVGQFGGTSLVHRVYNLTDGSFVEDTNVTAPTTAPTGCNGETVTASGTNLVVASGTTTLRTLNNAVFMGWQSCTALNQNWVAPTPAPATNTPVPPTLTPSPTPGTNP